MRWIWNCTSFPWLTFTCYLSSMDSNPLRTKKPRNRNAFNSSPALKARNCTTPPWFPWTSAASTGIANKKPLGRSWAALRKPAMTVVTIENSPCKGSILSFKIGWVLRGVNILGKIAVTVLQVEGCVHNGVMCPWWLRQKNWALLQPLHSVRDSVCLQLCKNNC